MGLYSLYFQICPEGSQNRYKLGIIFGAERHGDVRRKCEKHIRAIHPMVVQVLAQSHRRVGTAEAQQPGQPGLYDHTMLNERAKAIPNVTERVYGGLHSVRREHAQQIIRTSDFGLAAAAIAG